MIDRQKFWAEARGIFKGPKQSQVDGTNVILDYWDEHYPAGDVRWLAYVLATAFWETNRTMQPVREAYYLGEPEPAEKYRKGLRYYPYYGRGLVQLTWAANYKSMEKFTSLPLEKEPDLALAPKPAVQIIFYGMEHGFFGGTGLKRWFNDATADPVGARHLVNGTDHANDIAAIHRDFLSALT